eukprot:TRINITY_DN11587_c0_g5_i3.p1 TRINITY_DN11587_c0_g5~~TRINITY_DN11587_c0_g5_i3.p1  ORF type:complete len:147 (+),score=13.58 TRINITY_DN11587_c0_g5_i3:575-1015(+)
MTPALTLASCGWSLTKLTSASRPPACIHTDSFDGWKNGQDNFSYWSAIDYAGQSAVDYDPSSWYMDIEAQGGHAWGGVHWSYFRQRVIFNAYCGISTIGEVERHFINAGEGDYTIERIPTGSNSHNFQCDIFRVFHQLFGTTYGGP